MCSCKSFAKIVPVPKNYSLFCRKKAEDISWVFQLLLNQQNLFFPSKRWILFYLWMLFWQFVLLEFHFLCRRVNVSLETYPYHIILQNPVSCMTYRFCQTFTHSLFFLSDLPCSEWLNVSLIVVHQRFLQSIGNLEKDKWVFNYISGSNGPFLAVLNFLQLKLNHTNFEGVFSCFHGQKKI